MQILGEVPEGSGADAGVRFRKVPVQRSGQVPEGQVPEGSGTEVMRRGSGEFRCRYLSNFPEGPGADAEVTFRKIPMRRLGQVPRVPVHIPRSGSGRFRYTG